MKAEIGKVYRLRDNRCYFDYIQLEANAIRENPRETIEIRKLK